MTEQAKPAAISAMLLPCPFCGGEPDRMSGPPGCHYVRCMVCEVSTADTVANKAIAAWNRRAAPAPAPSGEGEVERLRDETARLSAMLDERERNWNRLSDVVAILTEDRGEAQDRLRRATDLARKVLKDERRRAALATPPRPAVGEVDRAEAMREDAERWRALMNCARIRMMGCSGFPGAVLSPDDPERSQIPGDEKGYLHVGIEFWNVHPDTKPNALGRRALTYFADAVRLALPAAAEGRTGEDAVQAASEVASDLDYARTIARSALDDLSDLQEAIPKSRQTSRIRHDLESLRKRLVCIRDECDGVPPARTPGTPAR